VADNQSATWEWGGNWENADETTKERFALTRLFWFYRMVQCGGSDGSDLDVEVEEQARDAAEWYGPILERRAREASGA